MKLADASAGLPDPEGGSRLRWWDGSDWSDRYRARPTENELAGRVNGSLTRHRRRRRGRTGASTVELAEHAAAVRHDTEAIIAEVRKVARARSSAPPTS